DAAGVAVLDGLQTGPHVVAVTARGFIDDEPRPVELAVGEETRLEVALEAGEAISGTVLDSAGAPLGGAAVYARPKDPQRARDGDSATSAADGSFRLEGLRPGAYTVDVRHEGFRSESLETKAPARDVTVVLDRGGGLRGTVLEEDGRPVAGVDVRANALDASNHSSAHARSDARGRFTLEGLADGEYALLATEAVTSDEEEPGVTRTATARARVRKGTPGDVLLRFERGLEISGQVVDEAGAPVDGARVTAVNAGATRGGADARRAAAEMTMSSARSGKDGSFTVAWLRPGAYRLTAGKEGFRPDLVRSDEIASGARGVRLVLKRVGMIRGRVVRSDGRPVTEYQLNFHPVESPEGRFEQPIRRAGEEELVIMAQGFASTTRRVKVEPGRDTVVGDIVLDEGRRVSGRVVDALTGKPVGGALVDVGSAS
ncbi:MAG: carboxypeptidase regulatory-like domain-containing protein, partial [Myxococcales bacterium]